MHIDSHNFMRYLKLIKNADIQVDSKILESIVKFAATLE